MDVEIYLHGVPDGQDYFGIKEEQTNAGLFYDNSTESVKLVVETKKNGDKAYTYYTYLRYKGIVGSGGRPGSYFGIALRLDMYYQDVIHIYTLLEIVFKKYIIGTLLAQSGDTYKYMVPSFSVKKAEIEQLQQGMIQLIQSTCVFSKFTHIDDSFIHPATNVATCNIADISDSSMLSAIKKYSKVALSPDYKLNLAKEYEKKIQEAEGKGGNIVVEKDKTINTLKATITSQDNKIAQLEQEIKRKDNELAQNKQRIEVKQTVESIKEPIIKLSKFFRVEDEGRSQKALEANKSIKKAITLSCSLSAIVLVLCIIGLFRTPSSDEGANSKELNKQIAELTSSKTQLEQEVTKLNQDNTDLKNSIESRDNTIRDLQEHLQQKSSTSSTTTAKTKLRIDVADYNGGNIYTEREYDISVKNAGNDYTGGGSWNLTNADRIRGSNSDSKITIKPKSAGNVVLRFEPYDVNYQCNTRKLNATTQPDTLSSQSPAPKDSIQSATHGTTQSNGDPNQPNLVSEPVPTPKVENTEAVEDNPTNNDNTIKIEIDPDVNEVKKGQEYTFSIKGYNGDGEWSITGANFRNNDKKKKDIKVKVTERPEGKVVITYTPKDKDPIEREFNVVKQDE